MQYKIQYHALHLSLFVHSLTIENIKIIKVFKEHQKTHSHIKAIKFIIFSHRLQQITDNLKTFIEVFAIYLIFIFHPNKHFRLNNS